MLKISADDKLVELYIDGVEVNGLPNRYNYWAADSVPLPQTAQTIAVWVNNTEGIGGLLASSKLIISDDTWKVATEYTAGWMSVTFDDGDWNNATVYRMNKDNSSSFVVSAISSSAAWISTNDRTNSVVYFRYRINYCDEMS